MKIGIDLDNCVFDTCSVMLDELGIESDDELKKAGSYWIEDAFGIDPKLVDRAVIEAVSSDSLPIIKNSDKVLNWLQVENKPLYFISDRSVKYYLSTWNQLRNISLESNILILTNNVREEKSFNKPYYANTLNIDVFIEDRPDTIMDLYNNTKCDILVHGRPWNIDIEENDRIYRMNDWIEIRDFFMRRIIDFYMSKIMDFSQGG